MKTMRQLALIKSPRKGRRGLMLLELVVAIVIIAAVLVPMSDAISRATVAFADSRFSLQGKGMAHMMMSSLVSQELPAFDEDGNGRMAGEGTLADFLREVMEIEEEDYTRVEWEEFEKWNYEYIKELVLINEENDNRVPDEDGYGPDLGLDDPYGDMSSEFGGDGDDVDNEDFNSYEDLLEMPHSQVIRIRLVLHIPVRKVNQEEPDEGDEEENEATARDKFVLVTFIDLDDFKGDAEDKDPHSGASSSSNNNNNKNNGNNGNNGGNSGK